MNTFDKDRLKQIPKKPGVYFFKDTSSHILYIGKAKELRTRVRSYFQKNRHQSAKNISMIKKIRDVDWIVVSSEVEALLTEANLIKKYQPFYNVNLRDDKSFPYIRITKEPYPRVFITRTIVKDGSRYFGPYTDVIYLRRTLKAIRAIFPIRSCDFFIDDDVIEKKKISLCLDYHIKKCEGPCEGMVSEQIYGEMISNVIKFLNGRTNDIENSITEKMNNASRDLRFEDAGVFRDQLTAIKDFRERQRKVSADFKDRDIFALATDEDYGIAVVVRIRNGRINSREKLSLRNLDSSEESIFETILTRFYLESDFIPNEIVLPKEPTNSDQLIAFLKQKRKGSVKFKYAERGEKAKELRLAYQNAKLLLGEWKLNRMKRKDFVPKMVEQLKDYAPWFGRGRGDMELKEKEDGLCDYMFSVAIENSNQYFSEKLLDCFLTGTIPIYYGTPSVDKWFNMDGMIMLEDGFDIEGLTEDMYHSKIDAVKDNFERALKMEIVEDYMWENYYA